MPLPVSVVISCAGVGRRLGLGSTKALARIHGRPLIHWQLDALRTCDDIRIVVGYQASSVIDCVREIRSDVVFAFNHEYETTGTAASFAAGAIGAPGLVASLDGDLIVRPDHLARFLAFGRPCVGVLTATSDQPVLARVDSSTGMADAFSREPGLREDWMEWSGLCLIEARQVDVSRTQGVARGHVYEMLQPHLPLPALGIDAREIDTPDDFERAEQWLQLHAHLWSHCET